MATLKATQVTGTVTATVAAANPTELTRKQEMDAALAGKADTLHTHGAVDVSDFAAAALEAVASWVAQLGGDLDWQMVSGVLAPSGVLARLAPSGGLLRTESGLAIDPELLSQPGHTHLAGDVTDLADVVTALLLAQLEDSATLAWLPGSGVRAEVRLRSAGGLTATADGLAVAFGPGATQAATGDHSHAQLHAALTLAPSESLALSLVGQELFGEVLLEAQGGLLASPSGLAVDFGPGSTQAARGDHTHPLGEVDFGAGVSTWASDWLVGSSTIAWTNADGTLAPSVKLDLSTGSGHAPLGQSSSGLYVALGSGVAQAAPGNHGHSTATADTAGFLSATDKAALAGLLAAPELSFGAPLRLASGVVSLPAATIAMPGYLSAEDKVKLEALQALTFTAPLTEDDTGAVRMPPASASQDGYLTAAGAAALAALTSGVRPRVTATDWGFMDPADQVKLEALAQIEAVAAPLTLVSGVLGVEFGTSETGLVIGSVTDPLTYSDGVLGIDTSGLGESGAVTSVTAPLVLTAGVLSLPAASSTVNGYMSSADKANLATLTAMGLNSGVINATMEFAGGLDPAIRFDSLGYSHWDLLVNDGAGETLDLNFNDSIVLRVDGSTTRLTSWGGFNAYGGGMLYNDIQVVGAQGVAVGDATGTLGSGSHVATSGGYGFATALEMNSFMDNVANAIAQLNTLLARCRAHGLIAT